jgi:TolB protein
MKTLTLAIGVLLAAILIGASGSNSSERDADATSLIAYSCSGDICLVGADGREIRRLTHDKYVNAFPAWSPDGRVIAFTAYPHEMVIDLISADGAQRRRLTPRSVSAAFPAWSPDGKVIAFDDDVTGTIELLTSSGGLRRPLGRQPASLPSWSPDGRVIAFVARNGRALAMTYGDIHALDVASGRTTVLTRDATFPAWSPDGKRIAFLRRKRGTTWLWIMNRDGDNQRRLCRADIGAPSWSPSGRQISFAFDADIYSLQVDDGKPTRITLGHGDNLNPAWQPKTLDR